MGANGSGTRPVGMFLPTNWFPSAAYADGRYEQAGIGESPPSSDARHFFIQLVHQWGGVPARLLFRPSISANKDQSVDSDRKIAH